MVVLAHRPPFKELSKYDLENGRYYFRFQKERTEDIPVRLHEPWLQFEQICLLSHLKPLLHLGEETISVSGVEWPVGGIRFVHVSSRIRREMLQEKPSHGLHAPVPILGSVLDVRRSGELLQNLP